MKKLSLLLGLLLFASTSWAGPWVTGPVYNAANVDINGGTVDGTVIGDTTPAKGVFSPSISKGPAAFTSFAGTISRSGTTLTFSSAADAILAGYSATSPVVGTTVIHPNGPVTMYITAWLSNVTATVDSSGTLVAQTATSVQLPISSDVTSAGVLSRSILANGKTIIRAADAAAGMKLSGVTGGLSIYPYINATYGVELEALNTAESGYIPLALYGSNMFFLPQGVANIGFGTATFGTSAAKNVVIGEGTAPTTSPANAVALWSADLNGAAGTNRLHERTESGVSSPIALQTEVDASINPKAMSQAVALTAASSGSSGITVADNDNIDSGTGNFTLVWRGSLPDWTPSAAQYFFVKHSGAEGYGFGVHTDGTLRFDIADTGALSKNFFSTVAPSSTDGTFHELVGSFSVGAVNTTVSFYAGGVQLGTGVTDTNEGSLSSAVALYIMGNNAARNAGTTSFAAIYNRALTASEVKDLYLNGVAESDKWGSQTELITNGSFDSDTTWTKEAGITIADGVAKFIASFGTLYQNINQVAGKRYRITYTILNFGDGSFSSVIGTGVYGATHSAGGTYSEEFTAATTGSQRIGVTSQTSGSDFQVDNVSLVEIGATLCLSPENIGIDKWYDASSNGLNATYPTAGATLTRPVVKSIKQGTITAGGTGAVTVTIDMILGGVITADPSAARAYTFETGATSDAIGRISINDAFEWTVINTNATYAVTVTASSGHTIVGNAVVALSSSGRFKTVKTAASTFVTYRLN